MPIELRSVIDNLNPERTVLLFGAGASVPSGAPSVKRIKEHLEKTFDVSSTYTLPEQSGIIEGSIADRKKLISSVRELFRGLKPTGSMLNLPLYPWRSIYTTNYDDLVESTYHQKGKPISTYSSNFDFGVARKQGSVQYFKLHGTIDRDASDGDKSTLVLTDMDYDNTEEFREKLFDRMKSDLSESTLVIIGQSLADPDIKSIIHRASTLNQASGAGAQIYLLMYERDDRLASLHENRGIRVCFGGLDDFFSALAARTFAPDPSVSLPLGDDPLDIFSDLRPSTLDAGHASKLVADVSLMYNGWAASYADIRDGLTFKRTIVDIIINDLKGTTTTVAVILGASGVGKTTAARQVLVNLLQDDFFAGNIKQISLSIQSVGG
jgi:hypothetical protein